jgi:hypothetical protein
MGIGLGEVGLLFLLVLFGMAFWIWMILDCANNEPSGSDKIVWILIILLGNFIGAAIYFFARRPRRKSEENRDH